MPEHAERVALRDGREVAIRPIEPRDREGIAAAFERMSDDTRYRRFMSLAPALTQSQLTYLTEVDHHDHEALIVYDPEGGGPIGAARFVRLSADPSEAEVAVAVVDDWHGRGVATLLLDRLSARAREEGVECFVAIMLPENQHALDVFTHLGAIHEMDDDEGVRSLRLQLAPGLGEDEPLREVLRAAARGDLAGGVGPFAPPTDMPPGARPNPPERPALMPGRGNEGRSPDVEVGRPANFSLVDDPSLISDAEALDAYSRTVTSVAERLAPSVASLRVYRRTRGGRRQAGGGSGVVITPDGFILTSAHVVEGGDGRPRAVFDDGREFDAAVVGADPLSDLALLRAEGGDLTPATLGDAEELRVGQLVVALGSPNGLSGSLTAGIVSALGRSLPTRSRAAGRIVENVIQIDAALNPGNSGGALGNGAGEVVGINTAVAGVGLGLAVPINGATRRIIADLMRDGRVRRAYVGVAGGTRPLPPRVAAAVGRKTGAEIVEVVSGSPADRAGLRAEDVIVALGETPVEGVDDIQRLMTAELIGAQLEVEVVRDGELRTVHLAPIELEA